MPFKPKTFFVKEHGRKEIAFVQALLQAGWKRVPEGRLATVSLFDSDASEQRLEWVSNVAGYGSAIVLYPHASHPQYWYDCGFKWSPHIRLNMVVAPAHKRFLDCIGYDRPIKIVGWPYCALVPFRPSKQIRHIVYAPRHANGNGYLQEVDKQLNLDTFYKLFELWAKHNFKFTVRYIGSLENIGLSKKLIEDAPGIRWVQGAPDLSYKDIEEADLVVGTQTYAYLAIARGKPTVMYGEQVAPRYGYSDEMLKFGAHWDEYKEGMIYPYDITEEANPWALLQEAAGTDASIKRWKMDHIGDQFYPLRFADMMEQYRQV